MSDKQKHDLFGKPLLDGVRIETTAFDWCYSVGAQGVVFSEDPYGGIYVTFDTGTFEGVDMNIRAGAYSHLPVPPGTWYIHKSGFKYV